MKTEKVGSHKARPTWDEWYSEAKKYASEYSNLLVPRDYQTPSGMKLGRWIERQRALYNGVRTIRGALYLDQIMRLNAIGMVWKLENRYSWAQWMFCARHYYRDHGDLLVPASCELDGSRLGDWVSIQRRKYANGELTETQVYDLEQLGMVWHIGNHKRDWMDWYKDACRYFEAHGDLLVPINYKTEAGNQLGRWIEVQRQRYQHRCRRTPLEKQQIEWLEKLRMVWDLNELRQNRWEQMYAWVTDYKNREGVLPLWPRNIQAPDGRSMSAWIDVQRTCLGKGKYDAAMVQRLKLLGITAPARAANRSKGTAGSAVGA